MTTLTITDVPPMIEPGDIITMPITYYRKWWQFWKPRHWTVTETFVVTTDQGIWKNGD